MPADRAALERLHALPRLDLAFTPTPVDELVRFCAVLAATSRRAVSLPRLFVKRDDAIPIGFGGNKIRKLQIVGAQALAAGADTLITSGGIQSNHARATASIAAKLGLDCVLVANGAPVEKPTANALLDRLLGAEVRYVDAREARAPEMDRIAAELRARGRRPFVIPLGASTAHGAAAFAQAVSELLERMPPPDVIVTSTSSGGTQAGLLAGCALHGLSTRVVGISADDPAAKIGAQIRRILGDLEVLLAMAPGAFAGVAIEIDDAFVGDGYGVPTPSSTAAISLAARTEALFLDPTYTGKAVAGLIAKCFDGTWAGGTVLFWHTGGQVGLFA